MPKYMIILFLHLISINTFAVNHNSNIELAAHRRHQYVGTLDKIKEKNFLRVLTNKNSFNYFISKGKQSGFEYEMVFAFNEFLNKELKLDKKSLQIKFEMIPVDPSQLIPMLVSGSGDIIAAGLTQTEERAKKVLFSESYNEVSEIVVHHPSIVLNSLDDLSGKVVHVRKSSSYRDSLKKLNVILKQKKLTPLTILWVNEGLSTETILEMVSVGKYQITVADNHIAEIASKAFGNLVLKNELKIRDQAGISWAVDKRASDLNDLINKFMPSFKKGSLKGNLNISKYYENTSRFKNLSRDQKQISKYDSIFKKFAKIYNWDWRILAALAYQESKFKQDIKNPWGAIGIMQIKRFVASEPYISINSIEGKDQYEDNIHAGVKYLSWLRESYFNKEEISEKNKIRFSLASYNAGPGRIKQARIKAKSMGHNPDKWFREVEYALLAMNKSEPVDYVSSINQQVLAYSALGFKKDE